MDYKKGVKIGIHKLVNLALIGAALGLIVTSIIVYNTWPIYTATNIIPQEEAKFPDLTFCSLSNGYKEQVLEKEYIFHYPIINFDCWSIYPLNRDIFVANLFLIYDFISM